MSRNGQFMTECGMSLLMGTHLIPVKKINFRHEDLKLYLQPSVTFEFLLFYKLSQMS